ncbi:thiol-disulfide oxidoreductase DCC family protein [Saccharospirillum impatiens]|uniref:thiol-disulfide oxidoreductase DCC family protein n=1 Tax=Saccharospirillum impatiens TaxID=169438 RepID=UPI000404F2D8|nr:DUF393 domain-containing protein [Saccharospirillum impatiens]
MNTLYFDGSCPLCAKEIRLLRRLCDDGLALRDIHDLPDSHQPDREVLLRTLHLQTTDGDWVTGLNATVSAWQHTRVGWVFRPLLWPGVKTIASRVYRRWADRRFDRRYCSTGTCQLPPLNSTDGVKRS